MGAAYVSRRPHSAARISMQQRKSHLDGSATSNITPAGRGGGYASQLAGSKKEHCACYKRRGYEVNRTPTHLSKKDAFSIGKRRQTLLPIRKPMRML